MADYLAHGAPEKWLARVRPILGSRLSEYKQFLKAHFPAGTAHTCPRGGFITWVELPEKYDSRRIFKLALENDLSVSPGPIFSADQSFTNFLRINYASALTGKHLQALKLLSELIKQSTH